MVNKLVFFFFLFFVNSFYPLVIYAVTDDSTPIIISIAGGSGAGKTTFAKNLASSLGEKAIVINQDDYYKDLSHLPIEARRKINFAHPSALDFTLLIKHLKALKSNMVIEKPLYDFTIHSRKKLTKPVVPKPIIILEGVLLFSIPEIRELSDIKLFIEAPSELRILRLVTRDISERKRTLNFVTAQYINHIYPVERKIILPSKKYADLIIPNGGKNKIALQILVEKLNK